MAKAFVAEPQGTLSIPIDVDRDGYINTDPMTAAAGSIKINVKCAKASINYEDLGTFGTVLANFSGGTITEDAATQKVTKKVVTQ